MAEREFAFERVINFRDLGGYRTSDGRSVRWRRLFRSGSPHRMSEDEATQTLRELGLRTVIDLRSAREVGDAELGPLIATGVARHHVPLGDNIATEESGERDWTNPRELYVEMLAESGDQAATALSLLADESALPVLFHCSFGKDRAGILAALVLGAVCVDRETIVGDYAISARAVERFERDLRSRGRLGPDDSLHPGTGVWPEAMERLLDFIESGHGSVANYLRAQGVSDATLRRLSELLLE